MQILNLRLGFATNSSSTHSILYLPKRAKALGIKSNCPTDNEFNSRDFLLANKKDKARYLYQVIKQQLGEELAKSVTEQFIGGAIPGYVESAIIRFGSTAIPPDLCAPISNRIIKDDTIIIKGGMDDSSHPTIDLDFFDLRSRYDEVYKYWTLFNTDTGGKLRFSDTDILNTGYTLDSVMSGGLTKQYEDRASIPELVDLKITDYCEYNCPFCDQNSTKNGTHAPLEYIKDIIDLLVDLKVFEIALGGGEPTSHPDFDTIIAYAARQGICINYTTRNPKQLGKGSKSALSVTSLNDLKKVPSSVRAYNVQVVDGCISSEEFSELLDYCSDNLLQLTLLGFKKTGRGMVFKPQYTTDWFTTWKGLNVKRTLQNEDPVALGIDTVIAQNYPDVLNTISPLLYSVKEGQHSMYIDAVSSTMGPSSFCNSSRMTPLDLDRNKFLTTYRTYQQ